MTICKIIYSNWIESNLKSWQRCAASLKNCSALSILNQNDFSNKGKRSSRVQFDWDLSNTCHIISLSNASKLGLKRQLLMGVLNFAVLFHCVTPPPEKILGREQPLDPNWTPRMQPPCGYRYFCSKAIPETVTEPCGGIHMQACTVNPPQELLSCTGVLCKKALLFMHRLTDLWNQILIPSL